MEYKNCLSLSGFQLNGGVRTPVMLVRLEQLQWGLYMGRANERPVARRTPSDRFRFLANFLLKKYPQLSVFKVS
jgi:hypothetical protein